MKRANRDIHFFYQPRGSAQRRGAISGGTAVRLAVMLVVMLAALLTLYVEKKAFYDYQAVYERVEVDQPKNIEEFHKIVGREPTEEQVHGKYFIEKYVYAGMFGRKYVYYAVFDNAAEQRDLIFHYQERLPSALLAPKPDLPAPPKIDQPLPEQELGPPSGNFE